MRNEKLKKETKRRIKRIGTILFVLYILVLIYFLFFSEGFGRGQGAERVYRYNLTPLKEIRRFWVYREQLGFVAVFTNLVGNVVGFVPFGLILPVINRNTRNLFFIGFAGFALSLCVECIQLVGKVGSFDVDDMILNTAGAVLGYLIFAVFHGIYKIKFEHKRRKRR